jgi:hypothetical protein
MSNETYTDLEKEYLKNKHKSISMKVIEALVKQYPNDADLGKAIREFILLSK